MNENTFLAAPHFDVQEVSFDDPRGHAIRHAMDVEMSARYAGSWDSFTAEQAALAEASLSLDPVSVITTLMAFAPDGTPAAHVILRDLRGEWEVKRVITAAEFRGTGIASRVMRAAHDYAQSRGAQRIILQCGLRQPEAVALYTKLGYVEIPVYEPYKSGLPGSLCFAKSLEVSRLPSS